jgi:hypothetical protein
MVPAVAGGDGLDGVAAAATPGEDIVIAAAATPNIATTMVRTSRPEFFAGGGLVTTAWLPTAPSG